MGPTLASTYQRRLLQGKLGIVDQHVEGEGKGHHQHERQDDHPPEDVEDVHEHDDVNPCDGELAEEDDEVDPREEDGYGSDLPLPVRKAEARRGKDEGKYDGRDEEDPFQVVDPVEKVRQPHLPKLEQLKEDLDDGENDHDDGGNDEDPFLRRIDVFCNDRQHCFKT